MNTTSKLYKERFSGYQETYIENCAKPPPMMPSPSGASTGAQKTALTRKVRYNDERSRQSTTKG